MRESAIEKKGCFDAEADGWLTRKLTWVGRVGAPDRFMVKNGRVVLIEFKAPGKEARPEQVREHERLREAGVEVYVIDNLEELRFVLDEGHNLV